MLKVRVGVVVVGILLAVLLLVGCGDPSPATSDTPNILPESTTTPLATVTPGALPNITVDTTETPLPTDTVVSPTNTLIPPTKAPVIAAPENGGATGNNGNKGHEDEKKGKEDKKGKDGEKEKKK